jgi:decaprenyl-phosphate phosphoribosyltransferase
MTMNTKTIALEVDAAEPSAASKPTGIGANFSDYLALIRLKFHLNFALVIYGAASFTDRFDFNFFSSLLLLYISFNVFLYGGIYTINAITDLEKDAKHPLKCHRPLPSGRISKNRAIGLAATLITLGLIIGFGYFGPTIGVIYLGFIGINLFYSLVAREIPYVELFVNASTMPLRTMMGALMVTGHVVPVALMVGAFCKGIGFLTIRRIVEKDVAGWKEGRPALKAYQGNVMLWIQLAGAVGLLLAFALDPLIHQTYIAFASMALYYAVFCLGIHIFPSIRRYWQKIYTN